jgi:hypothetical protein
MTDTKSKSVESEEEEFYNVATRHGQIMEEGNQLFRRMMFFFIGGVLVACVLFVAVIRSIR